MKACEVEARFNQHGKANPSQLTWDDQMLLVLDIGRRWQTDDGEHVLVKVRDGRIFELLYNGASWQGRQITEDIV